MARLNPETQYADDRNLAARQRLWDQQDPHFDIVGWVLDLAGAQSGHRVLDVGCGNGRYLAALADRGIDAVGVDLSVGMLAAAPEGVVTLNADVTALSFAADEFDVVLAPHMLYHVPDRTAAAHELRRVLRPGGVAVAVTNATDHTLELRQVVEHAARPSTPGWEMRNASTDAFTLENGAAQLAVAFDDVEVLRAEAVPVRTTDAGIVADYVSSLADFHAGEVAVPWADVVEHVRTAVERIVALDGVFEIRSGAGAFVCR